VAARTSSGFDGASPSEERLEQKQLAIPGRLLYSLFVQEIEQSVAVSSSAAAATAAPLESRSKTVVTKNSAPADKIKLFRSLFRGREDVYPRRFENHKTGKSGYAPACANEWIRGVCEKPRIKCSDCPNRRFFPVTDETVGWHLSGRDALRRDFVMGLYAMLCDETCFFLAVDFDGEDWQKDAGAFLETSRRLAVPVALERSRSGNGAHIWFFFDEAIPAGLARKMGSHLLTETMENRPEIGLKSYDRLFPNQDTLPRGGFGNLIALPLQKQPRERGNTVFLDGQFAPYADQWAFLASLQRMSRIQVENMVRDADSKGRVIGVRMAVPDDDDENPWMAQPSRRHKDPPITEALPEKLELVLADQIYIAKENLMPPLRNRLVRLAAFQNPEFYRAQAMRLPTYDKPRIVACAEDHPRHFALPRGCLDDVLALLKSLKIQPELRDERFGGQSLRLAFCGQLRPEQQAAANALSQHDTGVLAATTAFGKTVIAAWLIAHRGVNTIVLVHRQQLLEQWIERLSVFLDLPEKTVGRLGGGCRKLTGKIDVALIQSLVRKDVVNDCIGNYGYVIVDECHHLSARSFELVARRAKAKFVTGLSATVGRKDGHHPIIFMQCGPVRHRVNAKSQAAMRPFTHQVYVRPTSFRPLPQPDPDPRMEFHHLYEALRDDVARNQMICSDVLSAINEGRSPLVLTERTEHLQELASKLSAVPHVLVLRGGQSRKELDAARALLAKIPGDTKRVILATGKFIGEGFDDSRLDTLFLALPVSWRGTIAQYVGRLHRLHEGKREVRVYDYADLNVPMLSRMFDRRCQGYESLGYTILLPASALPGWPVEVPLPVAPEWKRDYAASVRRLIRDGVDIPLAGLFVNATRIPSAEAEGEARARSASEAFLFRRLDSLPETSGHFRLNSMLPIPFDGTSQMEVDFLCSTKKLVIELDGTQHLSDAEAYRRDRRKDRLLQQHGYFLLRFLAEDVGKHLDLVLDTILAMLVHLENARERPARQNIP
jgi:superfamily II DNA or RNA helicase